MKEAKKHSVLRVFLIEGAIVLVLIGLAALGYTFRTSIRIAYHRNREKAAIVSMQKTWKANGGDDAYRRHQEKLVHHKEALLNLGYRQKHVYQTQYLKQGSPQEKRLFEEFQTKYPRESYAVGWGSDLEIEDVPERMPVWDQLIEKYDIPSADPCQPINP